MMMHLSLFYFKNIKYFFQKSKPVFIIGIIFFLFLFTTGCVGNNSEKTILIDIDIQIDGTSQSLTIPAGLTVQEAISSAGIKLGSLDEVNPPGYTILTQPTSIKIIRTVETFKTEQITIAFEHQTIRNESLPEGESILIQSGSNGIEQNTYRIITKDNAETTKTLFKTEQIQDPKPEIIMVGVQTPFTPQTISGRLAYLTAGNAWVMEGKTSLRRPVVTTGDLDGRIFSLSPNGNWLLFTRKARQDSQDINSLWIVNLSNKDTQPVDLGVQNIIHFAGWNPAKNTSILFSTVEPRSSAPGWQANNDLNQITIDSAGNVTQTETYIESNSGGIYGWWGTNFIFSTDGKNIAYARPDSVGLVDLEKHELIPVVEILPFQTRSDWAWIPGVTWSKDSSILYVVTHNPTSGMDDSETSPLFDLSAIIPGEEIILKLAAQTGMFAYPSSSPTHGSIAFMEAIFPEQSDSSRYRLVKIDQDGSNRVTLFPPAGSAGLEPQQPVWEPGLNESGNDMIAMIYQGNIYLVSSETAISQQITGDGLITRIDWK